ncbi:MAG: ribonuclease P protein component [Dehalococcoidales bacterium]|nr:ribonuclease P protein component [Dehalococcoidales bacterium]
MYLTKPEEYALVYSKGNSWATKTIVLRATPNSLNVSRCGFSVGKKVGGAVVRNKIKRRLREITRLTPVSPGWDMVLIVRQPAAQANYAGLQKSYTDLLARARILPLNQTAQ